MHPFRCVVGGVTALSVAGGGTLGTLSETVDFSSLGYSVLGGTITAAVTGPLGARWPTIKDPETQPLSPRSVRFAVTGMELASKPVSFCWN